MSIEADILLTHRPMDPLYKDLLLEPVYHCGINMFF
jgi:hypothetical protein